MREAFLWGQVAGPILGGCLVWGRSGPSMVFSRAVLSACLVSLLVPAAWRGPSHVALRLVQGLCTVSRRVDLINVISLDAWQRELREISRNIVKHGARAWNADKLLRDRLLQGATMPAAHMLAMTWFKSHHRSWYFSCYAGRFVITWANNPTVF